MEARVGGSETEAELRKQTSPQTCPSPIPCAGPSIKQAWLRWGHEGDTLAAGSYTAS